MLLYNYQTAETSKGGLVLTFGIANGGIFENHPDQADAWFSLKN